MPNEQQLGHGTYRCRVLLPWKPVLWVVDRFPAKAQYVLLWDPDEHMPTWVYWAYGPFAHRLKGAYLDRRA